MKIQDFKFFIIFIVINTTLYSFSIDKRVSQPTDSAFWTSHYNIPQYSAVAMLGFALYEGNENRLGKTAWKSIESAIGATIMTETLKKLTKRARPRWTEDPNIWQERGDSFPSLHVAGMTALITPFILEYQDDYPLVHLLWGLSAHQMIGRVKAQAHWQSDVLGGLAVGLLSGYLVHNQDSPFLLYYSEDKVIMGLKHHF